MLTTAQRATFARAIEPLLIETPIDRYLRISDAKHRDDALGIGPGSTRFSPTEARSADKRRSFLVLYLAENLATALYETVVRHALDYETSRVLTPPDYADRVLFTISTIDRRTRVTLLDRLKMVTRSTAYVPTECRAGVRDLASRNGPLLLRAGSGQRRLAEPTRHRARMAHCIRSLEETRPRQGARR